MICAFTNLVIISLAWRNSLLGLYLASQTRQTLSMGSSPLSGLGHLGLLEEAASSRLVLALFSDGVRGSDPESSELGGGEIGTKCSQLHASSCKVFCNPPELRMRTAARGGNSRRPPPSHTPTWRAATAIPGSSSSFFTEKLHPWTSTPKTKKICREPARSRT